MFEDFSIYEDSNYEDSYQEAFPIYNSDYEENSYHESRIAPLLRIFLFHVHPDIIQSSEYGLLAPLIAGATFHNYDDRYIIYDVIDALLANNDNGTIKDLQKILRIIFNDSDVSRLIDDIIKYINTSLKVDESAIPDLLAWLRDENDIIRKAVIEPLRSIGKPVVPGLLDILEEKNEDKTLCQIILDLLSQIGDPRAIETFIKALQDDDIYIHWLAAKTLVRFGNMQTIEILLELLGDENNSHLELERALEALLCNASHPVILERLLSLLEDKNPSWYISKRLETIFIQVRNSQVPKELLLALWNRIDPFWYVRKEAIDALEWLVPFDMPGVIEVLLLSLADKHEYVRRTAVVKLGKIRKSDIVVEGLLDALHDEDWYVRSLAAKSLGQIGDQRSVDGLKVALNDQNKYVQKSAREALNQLNRLYLASIVRP